MQSSSRSEPMDAEVPGLSAEEPRIPEESKHRVHRRAVYPTTLSAKELA